MLWDFTLSASAFFLNIDALAAALFVALASSCAGILHMAKSFGPKRETRTSTLESIQRNTINRVAVSLDGNEVFEVYRKVINSCPKVLDSPHKVSPWVVTSPIATLILLAAMCFIAPLARPNNQFTDDPEYFQFWHGTIAMMVSFTALMTIVTLYGLWSYLVEMRRLREENFNVHLQAKITVTNTN